MYCTLTLTGLCGKFQEHRNKQDGDYHTFTERTVWGLLKKTLSGLMAHTWPQPLRSSPKIHVCGSVELSVGRGHPGFLGDDL